MTEPNWQGVAGDTIAGARIPAQLFADIGGCARCRMHMSEPRIALCDRHERAVLAVPAAPPTLAPDEVADGLEPFEAPRARVVDGVVLPDAERCVLPDAERCDPFEDPVSPEMRARGPVNEPEYLVHADIVDEEIEARDLEVVLPTDFEDDQVLPHRYVYTLDGRPILVNGLPVIGTRETNQRAPCCKKINPAFTIDGDTAICKTCGGQFDLMRRKLYEMSDTERDEFVERLLSRGLEDDALEDDAHLPEPDPIPNPLGLPWLDAVQAASEGRIAAVLLEPTGSGPEILAPCCGQLVVVTIDLEAGEPTGTATCQGCGRVMEILRSGD